jgi:hypothetical protein|eukprot:jgi/Chrpa1/13151/Chrysochromulina_OHIO_Genome00024921-RA
MAGCRAEAPKHRLTPPHKLCVGRELLQKLRPLAAHAKVADEALNANDAHESVSKAIAQLLSAVPCLQLMRSSFVPALEALTLRAQHLVATGDQIQVRTLATLPPRARDPPANAAPVALLNRDGCRTTTHRLEDSLLPHQYVQLATRSGLVDHAVPLSAHRTHASPVLQPVHCVFPPLALKKQRICAHLLNQLERSPPDISCGRCRA